MNQSPLSLTQSKSMTFRLFKKNKKNTSKSGNNLSTAKINNEYIIDEIVSDDQDIVNFLFTLGCFKGESITLISILADNYVIIVKDARYSIDVDLAKTIKLF